MARLAAKMSNYFISGASGPMKAATRVEWEFADVGAKVAVDVLTVERDRKIVFEWKPHVAHNMDAPRERESHEIVRPVPTCRRSLRVPPRRRVPGAEMRPPSRARGTAPGSAGKSGPL